MSEWWEHIRGGGDDSISFVCFLPVMWSFCSAAQGAPGDLQIFTEQMVSHHIDIHCKSCSDAGKRGTFTGYCIILKFSFVVQQEQNGFHEQWRLETVGWDLALHNKSGFNVIDWSMTAVYSEYSWAESRFSACVMCVSCISIRKMSLHGSSTIQICNSIIAVAVSVVRIRPSRFWSCSKLEISSKTVYLQLLKYQEF